MKYYVFSKKNMIGYDFDVVPFEVIQMARVLALNNNVVDDDFVVATEGEIDPLIAALKSANYFIFWVDDELINNWNNEYVKLYNFLFSDNDEAAKLLKPCHELYDVVSDYFNLVSKFEDLEYQTILPSRDDDIYLLIWRNKEYFQDFIGKKTHYDEFCFRS